MICANFLSVLPSKAASATFFILVRKIRTILNRCRRQEKSNPLNTESPISRYVSRIAVLVENSYAGLNSFLRLILNIFNSAVLDGSWKETRIHTFCKLSRKGSWKKTSARLITRRHSTLKRSGMHFMTVSECWFQKTIVHSRRGKHPTQTI